MKNIRSIMPFLAMICLMCACQEKEPSPSPTPPTPPTPPPTPTEQVPLLTQKVNKFIVSSMKQYYLWNDQLPQEVDPTKEKDPFALFKKMRYTEFDPWSVLSNNAKQTEGELTNTTRSFGYALSFGQFSNSQNVFAVVLFVYPDSPAAKAGVKRGDILVGVNGSTLTTSNYNLLLTGYPSIRVKFGELSGQTIYETTRSITLSPAEMYLDPVITHNVTTTGSHKIGYLCYSDFTTKSHDKLNQVFQEFQQQQVTDIILDLRYNSGGAGETVVHLASLLAPAGVVSNRSLLLKTIWNKEYGQYLQQMGSDQNYYFDPSIPVNLNGIPLYVLTSSMTASASEATIVGLTPYMPVTTIGGTTSGKYCGGSTLQPAIQQNGQVVVDPELNNWMMYLITCKYANSAGLTDFREGLLPMIPGEESLASIVTGGLCTMKDPLFAKACNRITGKTDKAAYSSKSSSAQYQMLTNLPSRTGMTEGRFINAQPPSMP